MRFRLRTLLILLAVLPPLLAGAWSIARRRTSIFQPEARTGTGWTLHRSVDLGNGIDIVYQVDESDDAQTAPPLP